MTDGGCYSYSMLVTSFHFGVVCCTVPFLVLSGFLYSAGSHTAGFRTAWDLVQHGLVQHSISYSAGSRTARDPVQCGGSCSALLFGVVCCTVVQCGMLYCTV